MIQMHVAPSWDYTPVGPYTVIACSLVSDPRVPPFIGHHDTIVDALRRFEDVRSPLPERSYMVLDSNDVVLVAYNTGSKYAQNWIGAAAGFEAMRGVGYLEPLDVDLAEIEAHAAWEEPDE